MFDIGWSEMLVIAVVAFIVIGPKELPTVLRTVAGLASKARAAGRVFQQQLDEVMREANADDLKRQVDDALRIDRDVAERALQGAVDPQGEINKIWSDASAVPDPAPPATTEGGAEYMPPAPADETIATVAPSDPTRPTPTDTDTKPAADKAS